MSDRDSTTDGIERRGVLAALATGIGGAGLARGALASRLDAPDETGFVVEQGDRCVPIAPLSGDETVEAFYDYRTPFTSPSGAAYSSYGTTDLQRPETSVCFLYDGPEGLSLVVIHDELNDGTAGGAVTFDLAFEHPDRGSWVVGDDDYDAASNYDTFDRTAEGWSVDWTWADGRSDGGAYRPLGESFAVTIDPAFNEAAALYGDHYEGEITDWQVLSGDRDSPDRLSLALDEPLTIRSGTCAGTTTTTTTTTRETTDEQTTEDETTTDDETTTEEGADEESSEPISADVRVVPDGVNPKSRGRLPVVIRSTEEFDATALEPGSVAFGPAGATPVHAVRTDADGDGLTDLKLHFWLAETGIDSDTGRVRLVGETRDELRVEGSAEIRVVPGDREDDDENEEDDSEEREDEVDEEEDDEEDDEREGREDDDQEDDEEWEDEEDDEDDVEEWEAEEEDDEREDRDDERDEQEDSEDDGWLREGDEDPGRGNEQERGNGRGKGRGRGRGSGTGRGEDRGEGRDD